MPGAVQKHASDVDIPELPQPPPPSGAPQFSHHVVPGPDPGATVYQQLQADVDWLAYASQWLVEEAQERRQREGLPPRPYHPRAVQKHASDVDIPELPQPPPPPGAPQFPYHAYALQWLVEEEQERRQREGLPPQPYHPRVVQKHASDVDIPELPQPPPPPGAPQFPHHVPGPDPGAAVYQQLRADVGWHAYALQWLVEEAQERRQREGLPPRPYHPPPGCHQQQDP
ncbi:hypothetical protein HanIR_Chr03g0140281 [Helianthus annuus]|nr:hypothetical protein HanIR_Chr03g0140281 [Helianthus annuus]